MAMGWLPHVSDYYVGDKTGTILILHQVYICGEKYCLVILINCAEEARCTE